MTSYLTREERVTRIDETAYRLIREGSASRYPGVTEIGFQLLLLTDSSHLPDLSDVNVVSLDVYSRHLLNKISRA